MVVSGIAVGGFGALLLALAMPTIWSALGLL
jgi:sodium-dependent dicarboxylate transporter 2/3/5